MSKQRRIDRALTAFSSVVRAGGSHAAVIIVIAVCSVVALAYGMPPPQVLQFTALLLLGYLALTLIGASLERHRSTTTSNMLTKKSKEVAGDYERDQADREVRPGAAENSEVRK
jgi:hypothetical protein